MFKELFYRCLFLTAFLYCSPSHALWFDEIRDPDSLQKFCHLKAREFEVLTAETDANSEREKTLLKIAGMWKDLPSFYADPKKPIQYAQEKLKRQQPSAISGTQDTETSQVSASATTPQGSAAAPLILEGTALDFLNDYLKELSDLENTIYPLDSLNFLLAKTVNSYYDIQTAKYELLAPITAKRASLLSDRANALAEQAEETRALEDREKIYTEKARILGEREKCLSIAEKYALIARVWQKIKEAKLALFNECRSPANPPSLFRSLWIRPEKDDPSDPYRHGDALTSSMTGSMMNVSMGSMVNASIGSMALSQSFGLIRPFPLITFESQQVWEEYSFTNVSFRGLSNPSLNTSRVFNSLNEARFHYGQTVLEYLKDMIHKMKRVRIIIYDLKPQSPSLERMTLSYANSTEEDSQSGQGAIAAEHLISLSEEMSGLPLSTQQQFEYGLFSMIYQLFSSEPSQPQPSKDYNPWFNYKAKVDYLRHRMNLSPAQVDRILEECYL